MRVRLFKPGRSTRLLALGFGTLHLAALDVACGGKKFTASETPSASGVGGAPAASGEAGQGGVSDSENAGAPSAGNGGSDVGNGGRPAGCDCLPGEYCQDGTDTCQRCAEFERFQFGPAQKLTTLSQSQNSSERFARPAGLGSQLFYVSGAADQAKISYTATPVTGVGVPITQASQIESGPLLAKGFADQNLFFDRVQMGGRKLMMASWRAPDMITNEALLPEPINLPDFDDYSIAISPNTGHIYWMSTRGGEPELLWQATSESAPPPPAVLELKLKAGKAECPRSGEDATPWVNVSGTLLLFRNPSVNESCEANDSGATDLFAAPLDKAGLAAAAATPLTSLNNTGGMSQESDPALSPDSCTIYFASDNGTGDFDLYKATRN